ncbi:hypothetical protein EUGRSUZ_C01644 [Eucalyptus grandis]|uniref:Uncharacterized protein n=4 Tax=Eucalyptus grandis TaxID=71139 RepID=A0ACC3LE76_EUCGR|nr:hypothetical protein EUGRSUZ_C01644 [Eucalyptus grandis]
MIAQGNLVIDMWIIKEASGGKVQKHIGEGEWSCCWTCGTLDSQNSSGSFKLIIRHEFDMLQGCKTCGGRVQNHIGKEERSCCWACGPWDPHNALGSFKLIIRTSSVTRRYEVSLPGGGGDGVVPVVGAGSYRDPARLELGAV